MDSYQKIDRVLEYLQEKIHAQFQLHQFRILLMLAARHPDPVAYADIEKRLNLSNAAVSRNTKLMGTNMQKNKDGGWVDTGMHLVEVKPDVYETRRNIIALTGKGRKVMTGLKKLI